MRGWLQGVVVQADDKMVAIQFVDDVYLTDGWMVPDRVLWCRQGERQHPPVRPVRVRSTLPPQAGLASAWTSR